MIKLPQLDLDATENKKLAGYQKEIDKSPTYPERVTKAKDLFTKRNRKTNVVFRQIKDKLLSMCVGAKRCHYCEDSCPDEVEHFKPKNLYPEMCFKWENYLYSCGPCNGSYKRNTFKIITAGSVKDITRSRKEPVLKPTTGTPLLLNPREDNPLEYIELDFSTFYFVEIHEEGSMEYKRAEFTIELLGLNKRDILVEGRRSAFGSFMARLKEYALEKNNGATDDQLMKLTEGFLLMPHITVWEEMKRQRIYNSSVHNKLQELFNEVPEALLW